MSDLKFELLELLNNSSHHGLETEKSVKVGEYRKNKKTPLYHWMMDEGYNHIKDPVYFIFAQYCWNRFLFQVSGHIFGQGVNKG